MFKRILYVFAFLSISGTCFSQSTTQALASGQDPNVLYSNEASFGIFAHSRGFGVNYLRA